MDTELLRRVEALRRPLELAAKDRFAGVRRIPGLGVALRAACDGVIARAPSPAMAQWREVLGGWEALGHERQEEVVALGMRLMMRFPRAGEHVAATERAKVDAKLKPASTSTSTSKTVDDDPLGAPTTTLKGIGDKLADALAARGFRTVEDLVMLLPRRYDDVRDARALADVASAPEGERVTFVARVRTARMVRIGWKKKWGEARLEGIDGTGTAVCRWFGMWSGIEQRMPPGSEVVLSGRVKLRGGQLEFGNPDILGVEKPGGENMTRELPAILPRYPEVSGVPAGRLRTACAAACERVAHHVDDGVPATVERAIGLPPLVDAIARLHAPPPDLPRDELVAMTRHASPWHRRLVFGELFALGVAVALRRRERRADAAVPCARIPADDVTRALPFAPTRAQRRAFDELGADLAAGQPMNRLLQGDVGSGKTCVAFAAALQAARAGRQTAVMAPTELLAEQHAATWTPWAQVAKLRVALLTASTPKASRASLLAMLAAGEIDVLLGTHALLAEGVGFHALGLVVIDEQHRFGVAQRAKLRDKGDGQGAPHLLVMTATPIPRTLALTAYGDLDTSILDELPPGREPVATRVVRGARGQGAAYKVIGERVAAGERAYVVCPKVEASDVEGGGAQQAHHAWKDVETVHGELCAALPKARVGLVHGRLDAASRDAVMRKFKLGELDVLVATTVIEVGVDVPAATVMVVHDAERFGLAQLHQLRGRVGRGGGRAHCVLIAGSTTEDGEHRLAAMVATHDGFKIAEEDLALRGPGELLGPRQAGVPRLRFGELSDHTELLLEARRHADAVLVADPELTRPEHAGLKLAIARRVAHQVYGSEGG